jgi:hypothetical protein
MNKTTQTTQFTRIVTFNASVNDNEIEITYLPSTEILDVESFREWLQDTIAIQPKTIYDIAEVIMATLENFISPDSIDILVKRQYEEVRIIK